MIKKHVWIVWLLIGQFFNLHGSAETRELFWAIQNCNIGQACDWIARGADLNAKDKEGMTPLMRVICQGNECFVKILIAGGALVNCRDIWGFTPLHYAMTTDYAMTTGCINNVIFLLQAGADTTIAENGGLTPLRAMRQSTMSPVLAIPAGKTIEGFSV